MKLRPLRRSRLMTTRRWNYGREPPLSHPHQSPHRNRAWTRRFSGRHKWRPYGGGAERGAVKLRLRNVGAPLVTPGAPPGHNVPAAPALRQSPHTASTVVPATVRACVGHPGVINGAPTAAVSVMKHGDETAAANRRGATHDARCPVGAQRPRRTRTASIVAYRINHRTATAYGCAGHPCIKNGAPASAGGAERWGAVLCVRRNRG